VKSKRIELHNSDQSQQAIRTIDNNTERSQNNRPSKTGSSSILFSPIR